jgi:hypothetical protein
MGAVYPFPGGAGMHGGGVMGFLGDIGVIFLDQPALDFPGKTGTQRRNARGRRNFEPRIFRQAENAVHRGIVKRTWPDLPVFKAVNGMNIAASHRVYFLPDKKANNLNFTPDILIKDILNAKGPIKMDVNWPVHGVFCKPVCCSTTPYFRSVPCLG